MIDSMVWFVGCLNLFVFFCTDFYFAFVLNALKRDHPSIDDASPDGVQVDSILGEEEDEDSNNLWGGNSANNLTADNIRRKLEQRMNSVTGFAGRHDDILHKLVIIASFAAPMTAFMQMLSPYGMGWSMFDVPNWLGYFTMIPCLMVVLVYVGRALRIAKFNEVSQAQWLSLMWFRLDIIAVMAALVLLGMGDWLVAACLFTVDVYLASRLLSTERRLADSIRSTSLLGRTSAGDEVTQSSGMPGADTVAVDLTRREEIIPQRNYAATGKSTA